MPRAGFDLFIEQLFSLYDGLLRETSRPHVIRVCRSILAQLSHYDPQGVDETINIETATELFEELLKRAGGL